MKSWFHCESKPRQQQNRDYVVLKKTYQSWMVCQERREVMEKWERKGEGLKALWKSDGEVREERRRVEGLGKKEG